MKLPHRFTGTRDGDVTMTPMIDVVSLLLLFFVCTASFQIAEQILPTSLLTAGTTSTAVEVEPEPELERVLVRLGAEGGQTRWIVNERPYDTLGEVRDVLRVVAELDPGLPVILDVEDAVPLGDVIDVYDLSRIVGFDKIQFAADAE